MMSARGARASTGGSALRKWPFRALAAIVLPCGRSVRGIIGVLRIAAWPVDWLFRRVWGGSRPDIRLSGSGSCEAVVGRAGGAAFTVLAFLPARRLPVELIPPMHEGEFLVDVEAPEGTSLEHTDELALELEQTLVRSGLVETVFSTAGSESQRQGPRPARDRTARRFTWCSRIAPVVQPRPRPCGSPGRCSQEPRASPISSTSGNFSFRSPVEVEIFGEDVDALAGVRKASPASSHSFRS